MLLWHYTSIDVINSIFSNDKPTLRATHIHHLNDSTELKHGLKAIISLSDHVPGVKKLSKKMLEDEYDPEIYSFSLSKCEDSLYQWLAYCPNQGGISIGFEAPELREKDKISKDQLFYLPLPESDEVQIPQYDKCHYFKDPDELKDDWIKVNDQKHAEVNLLTSAMFLKHEAFHFEKEYRLFFHPMSDNPNRIPIKFQGNKPFIDFHFKPEVLKQIFISPRGNKELTKKTLKKLLKVKHLKNVEVIVSDIPFRE